MRSIIDILDLSITELDDLIITAKDIAKKPNKYKNNRRSGIFDSAARQGMG